MYFFPRPRGCSLGSARTAEGREGEGGGEGRGRTERGGEGDASARTRLVFTPGNFKKDATVRPSHGRPRGHRPIVRPFVRPSENVRVTIMP
jgi:hypothetical protein